LPSLLFGPLTDGFLNVVTPPAARSNKTSVRHTPQDAANDILLSHLLCALCYELLRILTPTVQRSSQRSV